jgi:hypothetical protein
MGTATSSGVVGKLDTVPERRYPFEDPGLAVDPPIIARNPDDVAEVRAEENYRLFVRFFDGLSGYVEMREAIFNPPPNPYTTLADPQLFAQVGLAYGTVAWINEVDLAPDVMYDEFKRNGVWVLR